MGNVAGRYGPAAVPAAAADMITAVPGGHTFSLKDITVANTTASAINFTLSVGADATGTRLYSAVTIPANSSLNWSGTRFLLAGEKMQGFGTATGLTITISYVDSS
jgi:hypothetical protein